MTTNRVNTNRMRIPHGMVLLLAVFVFGMTAQPYPISGASAFYLDKHLWLDGMPFVANPLWGVIIRALAWASPIHAVKLITGFSILCGLVAVSCCYNLNFRLLQLLHKRQRFSTYALCGASAAVFFLLLPPTWIVCTRAHPLSFDVALFLVSLRQLSRYQQFSRKRDLNLFGFLYGLGLVEYSPFLLMSLPLGLLTALLMRQRHQIGWSTSLPALLSVLAGVSIVIPLGAVIANGTNADYVTDSSQLQIIRFILSAQIRQASHAIPSTGWILVCATSVMPWVASVFETRRHLASFHHLSSLFMYTAFAAIAFMILVDEPMAPRSVLPSQSEVVLPYVLVASYFGLIVNYWRGALVRHWKSRHTERVAVRNTLIALLPSCVLLTPIFTIREVDPTPAKVLYQCAEDTLEAMGNRHWLVTDGSLDRLLRICAMEKGKTISLFSVQDGSKECYQRMMASHFEKTRLRSIAQLGVLPITIELMNNESNITDKLAFQVTGNMWLHAGFQSVPERLIYVGQPTTQAPQKLDVNFDRSLRFWSDRAKELRILEAYGGWWGTLSIHLRWQISRLANDFGTYLQQHGEHERARLAYQVSREAHEDNASALLNLASFADEEVISSEDLKIALELPIHDLVSRHGRIHELTNVLKIKSQSSSREPDLSDQMRREFQKAIHEYRSGDFEKAQTTLDKILHREPDNQTVWYLKGIIANLSGDEEAWASSWKFMTTLESPWAIFLVLQGEKELKQGHPDKGLQYFADALRLRPFDPRIVKATARAEFRHGEEKRRVEELVTRLLSLNPEDAWGNFVRGIFQYERGELDFAESSLRVAVKELAIPQAFNNLAWILTMRGALDEALENVMNALDKDQSFAPAWDTLGVILMHKDRLDEAQAALDRAITIVPDDWDIQVHRAQLYRTKGSSNEAIRILQSLDPEKTELAKSQLEEYWELCAQLGLPTSDSSRSTR